MHHWFLIITLFCCLSVFAQSTQPAINVRIEVDATKPIGKLNPIWRFFGADEPNYAYMKDGRKLLKELGQIGPSVATKYFRAHNLLSTGDGSPALKWGSTNAYTEDSNGNPVYNWTIVDQIFDAYYEAGMKPYLQIGFMPEALSVKPNPYQHAWTPKAKYEEIFTGWAHPPKSYEKWSELVFQWTKHCVERYGKDEVERWYFETWNEANAGYWQGTPEEFLKLHDNAIAGVKRALPSARVGGADAAGHGGDWTRKFFEHCLRGTNFATGETGTPIDFVSFHAKGAPKFVDGHVRMGIAAQLKTIDEGFAIVAGFPELKSKPIVIGESDPDGCAACQGPQLGYRNGTMYSSYTAASFTRKFELADKHGVNLEGALTWAFEFEDQPYFAGFRVLASNGIDLPVLNVFRMLGLMNGDRVSAKSSHQIPLDAIVKDGVRGEPDIGVFASADEKNVYVMLWHYHDDDVPGPDASVELKLPGVRIDSLENYCIDATHSNAYTAWQDMGSPQSPTKEQYAELKTAGQLTLGQPLIADGDTIHMNLPRQAVVLVLAKKQP
jgi:xylan 1,4-beta-xylosidase